MRLKDLSSDQTKIDAGEWVEGIPGMGDLALKVRGISSLKVHSARSKKEKAVPRNRREPDGSPKEEEQMRILTEVLHEVVLLDWKGIEGDDDKPLVYSPDMAKKLCIDPQFRPFQDAVVWASTVVSNGYGEDDEDDAKNFGKRSGSDLISQKETANA